MKKTDQKTSFSYPYDTSIKDLDKDRIKTTNVNILLNRVRLDQRKTLKKRIAFSIILVCLVSSLAIYFII